MSIRIKTEEQIEGIRKSCRLAANTLSFIKDYVTEGVTTEYLDVLADAYIRDHGAIPAPLNYLGFPKSICTSINEVICHGIPSEHVVLKNGDIINVDVTTILDGYYGDTSTMFAIGEISQPASELLAVAQDCLTVGIEQVKPGNEFYRISQAITDYASRRGFSVVYQFCGHGTGIEFHEEPQVGHYFHPKAKDKRKMQSGMIFTIEPMINQGVSEAVIDETDHWTARTKDGQLSAQYEHTILVVDGGAEVLTK